MKTIKLKSIFLIVLLSFLANGCKTKQANSKEQNKKPNFLFILLDDQSFDALQSSGRYPFLKTPHMQRLEDEGAKFNEFFVTQSICSPSRASFLTGTYPHIHGVNQNSPHLDPDWETNQPYNQLLQGAGYQTAHVGKIHMAHFKGEKHIRPGFDYWFSFVGQGGYTDPKVNDNGTEYREKGYMTDILTDKTIAWLKEKRDPNKPFSLNLWHKAVHEDHTPAPRHAKLFAKEKLPFPPYNTHLEDFANKPEWQRIKKWDSKWKQYVPSSRIEPKPWPIKGDKFTKQLECLLAVDESLGRVLATLEELGELDNTMIIYSSDNGYFMGEHGFWDKRIAYEHSMKIPMLIRYPKLIKPKTVLNQMALNIDLAPTILELAGVEKPSYMQGESFVKLFDQKTAPNSFREAIMFEYYVDDEYPYAGPDMLAIRTERYKLVDNFLENDIDELYDLQNDPGEMVNLINDPKYNQIQNDLRADLEKLKAKYKYNPDRDWWYRKVVPNAKK